MKKVRIFTFKQSNYGAILQAYALQHAIERNRDLDVEIVDFTTLKHIKADNYFHINSHNPIKIVIHYLLVLLRYPGLVRRRNRTNVFKHRYLNLTKRYSSEAQLVSDLPIANIYVTGSDQVFNPNSEYANLYYLNFPKGNAKKIAYAPSFGVDPEKVTVPGNLIEAIKDFDALSCREQNGADYLTKIVGTNVPTVVDPTLLLDKDEWSKIAIVPKWSNYIFIYDLNGKENLIQLAKRYQKQIGKRLKIVCLTSKVQKFYGVAEQIYDAGPAEFLGLIKYANFVITDSFHGSILSANFGVPFASFIALPKTSSRIVNILKSMGQEHRTVWSLEDEIKFDNTPVSYGAQLSMSIENSISYINRNIYADSE